MATVSRSTKISGGTTLAANTTARAQDVETDMLTLFNAHNNHDSGSSKWTVVSAEGASSIPLVVNNSTGTQNIAEFRDNGTSVLTIKDGGQLQASDGTAAAPTYSFSSSGSEDNGVYLDAANTVAISAGGTKRLSISTSAITSALAMAMGSNKITGLAAGTATGEAAQIDQVKILQVVQGTTDTQTSTTANSYQTTTLTASITPSRTSSKVLVLVSGDGQVTANTTSLFVTLYAAGAHIGPSAQGFTTVLGGTSTGTFRLPVAISYLHSPSTTSSTTYAVYIRNGDNASTVTFPSANVPTCTITLLEVNGL